MNEITKFLSKLLVKMSKFVWRKRTTRGQIFHHLLRKSEQKAGIKNQHLSEEEESHYRPFYKHTQNQQPDEV